MEPEAEGRVVNCHNQAELGQGGSCIDKRQRARGIWSQGSGGAASLRKSRSGDTGGCEDGSLCATFHFYAKGL